LSKNVLPRFSTPVIGSIAMTASFYPDGSVLLMDTVYPS